MQEIKQSEMTDKLILEFQWLPQLLKTCKEEGLDWLRMAAIAVIKSGGDPSLRVIDWSYLYEKLGPDNPNFLRFYDDAEHPTLELIDRATTWGLYQVHGQDAFDSGYKGQALGLSSVGSSIKLGISKMIKAIEDVEASIHSLESKGDLQGANELQEKLPGVAEQLAFGIDPDAVQRTVELFRQQITGLMELENGRSI